MLPGEQRTDDRGGRVTHRVYPNVAIGKGAQIGEFVLIGVPPAGAAEGELPTIIGDGAIIRSHTVIYAGNTIGNRFATGHGTLVRESNQIGDNVSIGSNSVIEHHVTIGNGVRIHSQAFVPEYSTLEDGCWIGPKVALTNVLHPLCPKAKQCTKGPTIRRNAKIGANSTVLPDTVIGEDALVGAGSVVVEDVPPRAVVVGNPARVVKGIDALTCPYELIARPYEMVEDR
ncbi:MAG: transferase [Chloroflexi bacterium]|nr:transferase [Chloroflexota bacterium]